MAPTNYKVDHEITQAVESRNVDLTADYSSWRHPSPDYYEPTTLMAFYDANGLAPSGYTLNDILNNWDFDNFDTASGDYFHTLFPLPEDLSVWGNGPVVNREVFEAFRDSSRLTGRLRDSFRKMLWYFGFEMLVDEKGEDSDVLTVRISLDPQLPHRKKFWDAPSHRNHGRIGIIIRSLRVLGLEKEALAFYHPLSTIPSSVGKETLASWKRAAYFQLNIEPFASNEDADEKDENVGQRFLWDFVQEQKRLIQQEFHAPGHISINSVTSFL